MDRSHEEMNKWTTQNPHGTCKIKNINMREIIVIAQSILYLHEIFTCHSWCSTSIVLTGSIAMGYYTCLVDIISPLKKIETLLHIKQKIRFWEYIMRYLIQQKVLAQCRSSKLDSKRIPKTVWITLHIMYLVFAF